MKRATIAGGAFATVVVLFALAAGYRAFVQDEELATSPVENFTFSPAGAAVYQLGQFGAAAKRLEGLELKS